MSTPAQIAILRACRDAARTAQHPFPEAAACEAALETSTPLGSWFSSEGYLHKNLLGIKSTILWGGSTVWLHGTEYIKAGLPAPSTMRNPVKLRVDGGYTVWGGLMEWCSFPDFVSCYQTQVRILHASARYALALAAKTPEEYIALESAQWATGPTRGQVVTQIYEAHKGDLA